MILLETTPTGGWRPGIGDPSLLGWATTGAYVLAAALAFRAFHLGHARLGAPVRRFWLWLSGGLLVLAANKQLDLQTGLTHLGRRMARSQGWYAERRAVQIVFMGLLAVLAGSLLALALKRLRRHLGEVGLALGGVVLLGLFVLLRANSIHHLDLFLGHAVLGVRMNHLLELGSLLVVILAAQRTCARLAGAGSSSEGQNDACHEERQGFR